MRSCPDTDIDPKIPDFSLTVKQFSLTLQDDYSAMN